MDKLDDLIGAAIRELLFETLRQPETTKMADEITEVVKGKSGLVGVSALVTVLNEALHQAPKFIRPGMRSLVGALLTQPDVDEVQEKEKEVPHR